MPRLSDAQFQDYEFRARRDFGNSPTESGYTTVVVGKRDRDLGYSQAMGSMVITRGDVEGQSWNQIHINKGLSEHGTKQEPSGQMRWTEGTMNPRRPDRVSWLGMKSEAPKSLLRGVMGLGVAVHGSIPVADYELSQHGAKIAQGAARKYGIKGHPSNPDMNQEFTYDDPESGYGDDYNEAEEMVHAQAIGHWATSGQHLQREAEGNPVVRNPSSRWQSFSAAQVGDITKDVEKNMLGKRLRVDSRVPVHPSQGKLF